MQIFCSFRGMNFPLLYNHLNDLSSSILHDFSMIWKKITDAHPLRTRGMGEVRSSFSSDSRGKRTLLSEVKGDCCLSPEDIAHSGLLVVCQFISGLRIAGICSRHSICSWMSRRSFANHARTWHRSKRLSDCRGEPGTRCSRLVSTVVGVRSLKSTRDLNIVAGSGDMEGTSCGLESPLPL